MWRCVLLFCLVSMARGSAEEPPLPDPANPVDYGKWSSMHYGRGITDNALDLYVKAFDAYGSASGRPDYAWFDHPRGSATGQTVEEQAVRRTLKAHKDALELFARAAQKPKLFFRPNWADGVFKPAGRPDKSLPAGTATDMTRFYETDFCELSLAVEARSWLHFVDDEQSAALDDLETILRATDHFASQPDAMSWWGAIHVGPFAYSMLRLLVVRHPDRLDYAVLLERLDSIDREPRSPELLLDFAVVEGYAITQRYLKDRDAEGQYRHYMAWAPNRYQQSTPESADDEGQPAKPGAVPLRALSKPVSITTVAAQLRDLRDQWRRILSTADYTRAREAGQALQRKLKEAAAWIHDPAKQPSADVSFTPGSEVMDDFWELAAAHREWLADRNATRLVLLLHAFKARTGRWPSDLTEAIAGKSDEFRRDPFETDLIYRIVDGQPLLYSVGRNGVDDGGRWPTEADGTPRQGWMDEPGDYIFWPAPKR